MTHWLITHNLQICKTSRQINCHLKSKPFKPTPFEDISKAQKEGKYFAKHFCRPKQLFGKPRHKQPAFGHFHNNIRDIERSWSIAQKWSFSCLVVWAIAFQKVCETSLRQNWIWVSTSRLVSHGKLQNSKMQSSEKSHECNQNVTMHLCLYQAHQRKGGVQDNA